MFKYHTRVVVESVIEVTIPWVFICLTLSLLLNAPLKMFWFVYDMD
jgi:hypothetical protein